MGKQTSVKNEAATPWGDLPPEILGFILSKFEYAADVIRCRAVCKNWCIPKDMITKYTDARNLPLLCFFSWARDRLKCEVIDPYSRLIFPTSILEGNPNYYYNEVKVYESKKGWLIAGYFDKHIAEWTIFLYNPYREHFISLSPSMEENPRFAAFSGNPDSLDCRVFVYCFGLGYGYYIARCDLDEDLDIEWRIMFLHPHDYEALGECVGMQYANEKLFCLFDNGVMRRYDLEDESWNIVDLGEGSCQLGDSSVMWLTKGEGDVLLAVKVDVYGNCSIFYFDWSNSSWVEGVITATFASSNTTPSMRPFVDYDENMKAGKVYLFGDFFCEKESSDCILHLK